MNTSATEIISARIINAPHKSFRAFTNPQHLKNWWGPNGLPIHFMNLICEQAANGNLPCGPDGANYENESEFVEIVQNERIVFNHISNPKFQMAITFEEAEGKTKFGFRMILRVKNFVIS